MHTYTVDSYLQVKAEEQLDLSLANNLEVLDRFYQDCSDLVRYNFHTGTNQSALLLYFDGLSDTNELSHEVIRPLMQSNEPVQITDLKVTSAQMKLVRTYGEIIEQLAVGNSILLLDQAEMGASIGLIKFSSRAIEEPQGETVVRGPREGFTESIVVNTSMLRRRLRTPSLKIVEHPIGRYSQTKVLVVYLDGVARDDIIKLVKDRLSLIDVDGVIAGAMIEEWIEDFTYSPFPQIQTTERPDVVTSAVLEGRVGILIENTPIAIIAPTVLTSLLQSPEDYYQRFIVGTLIRWLRYSFLIIALLAPSVYVAILTFHQEMVPTTLLLRIAQSREEIPFPALIEALIMEILFEALREAGIRLPKQVGSAVSIVGALVIGQAAIQAGLVSSPMVMVVAITGISSFMLPQYEASFPIRMLRFPIMVLSGMFGLFGLIIGLLVIVTHLCSLHSFTVPYLAPLGPIQYGDWKDLFVRAPYRKMRNRPAIYGAKNKQRMSRKDSGAGGGA
ncbi:spore germination protein [Paenibacillus sp. GCM10023252]|uniref:spore germination protein n=1 Tax=Paenibacillus sp. GCM10023252 TaxID=3252649 RepID=UPI00360D8434